MTDRDTFAAAALTGLLAQGDDGSFSEESYVRAAYRWADAMLRERGVRAEVSFTLTDAERQAIKEAADAYEQNNGDPDCERIADTLHGLLDRLGGT